MKQKKLVTATVLLLAAATLLAQTSNNAGNTPAKRTPYFIDPMIVDLTLILPPPPPQDSETTKAELGILHHLEQTRTPDQITAAQTDDHQEDIFLFKKVIGENFTADALPLTAALSAHVHNDEAVVNTPLKMYYQRPRPFNYESTFHPVCKTDKEPSYPSGHSMSGYLLAYTLAQIVPERREQIMERADDYAHNRLVCGVHYPSDLEASRRIAYVMFGYMLANPRFQKELAAAREETRQHLGLPLVTSVPDSTTQKAAGR